VSTVHTWADAFGMWHARVPDIGTVSGQRERARRVIAREVILRESRTTAPVIRLGAVPAVVDGSREWTERAS
jgi:hypothetical protein